MASTSKRTGELALSALLAGLAAGAYADFFSGWAFAPAMLAAAAGPALVAALVPGRWRAGRIAYALVALLPVIGIAATLLVPGGDRPSLPGAAAAFGRGLVDGWAALLAAGVPADATADLVATPLALTFLASAAAVLLARHTSAPVAPLAPSALALAAAVGLAGGPDGTSPVLTAAFLATALVLVAMRANRMVDGAIRSAVAEPGVPPDGGPGGPAPRSPNAPRSLTPAGRVAFGVPLVVGIAVSSPLVAAALPPGRDGRFDPRDLRDERLEIGDVLSPLVTLKAQLKSTPPEPLFRVELDIEGGPAPDRIRLAALDAYDGSLWTSSGEYHRAGRDLPGDSVGGERGQRVAVRQRVTVLGLDGPFLPAVGRAVALDPGDDVATTGFDAASGNLVTTRTDRQGTTYEVVSTLVAPGDDDLAAAAPSTDPALDGLRAPPPLLPPELASVAQAWTADAPSRAAELLALRDALRTVRYDDSADAEPGHSYDALRRVLLGDESEREGYAEQIAAAYVVLARSRGFAARLAVGYLLPAADPDGAVTITEAHAHAWPEVHLEGYGWVAIEPTGDRQPASREPDEVEALPGQPREAPPEAARPRPPVPPSIVEAEVHDDGAAGGPGGLLSPAEGGGMGAAVLSFLLLLPAVAKRWRRRRRRRAATPSARVVGAWRETLDRLVELGLPVPPSHTAGEVAASVAARFPTGAPAVADLVPLVDVAVCSEREPDVEVGERAWRLAGHARSGLRRDAGLGRRWRASVDPRPLVGRRGRAAAADHGTAGARRAAAPGKAA